MENKKLSLLADANEGSVHKILQRVFNTKKSPEVWCAHAGMLVPIL